MSRKAAAVWGQNGNVVVSYLRLLFSSYCAAYTFFIAAWDPRNGGVPKAGTSDAVLVLLGANLNRRRKLLQRGYPDALFINYNGSFLPCRLRSFNKGELYRFLFILGFCFSLN